MKRFIKYLTLWLFIVGMVLQNIYIPRALAEEVGQSITILFTHDMHSNFLPYKLEQEGVITTVGGYARLHSAINAEKLKDPEALLLDAGDFSMGTPFQTIFMSNSPELRIMGQMGYDVVTLGNHEFDYRASGLAESLNAAKESGDRLPQLVQSNISFPTDKEGSLTPSLTELKQAMNNYGVKDYTVLERNGLKIGIFGLLGADSASKAPMSEVVFIDEIEQAKRVVKILKEQEKVDLVVCLSHSGTWEDDEKSEDELLVKKVPEIDVIISGHTHTMLMEPIIVGDTVIGSSEDNGKNLGVMKLTLQPDENWKLDRYELTPINERISEEEGIAQRVSDFKKVVEDEYFSKFGLTFDEVIANAPFNFPTKDEIEDAHDEATLGNMISDAYVYAVKQAEGNNYIPVDAAIVPVGTIRGSLFEGAITAADAFSISSLGIGADKMPGYPLISVYLTGKELKAVCEVDASVTPLMSDAQLFISGLQYTFNPNRLIFNKVTESSLVRLDAAMDKIQEDNLELIDDDKLYRVIAGLYSAQMLSVVGEKSYGLLKIEPKTKEGTPITDYEAQIIYRSEGEVKTEVKEWYAIVSYLKSFDKVDNVPTIPEYYQNTQGRKVVEDNKNILVLISKPNWIALTVYGIVVGLTALIIMSIVIIVRRRKRKVKRKPRRK